MQGPRVPLQNWQIEEPHAVPPRPADMKFFTQRIPGTALGPDGQPVPTTMIRLRVDHEHGRWYGIFTPDGMRSFAEWLTREANMAESGIIIGTELPPGSNGNGQPPE